MNSFVQGLLFGMVLQLSVGPVCLTVFQKAITGHLRWALWMVLGVALADGVYIVLALAGVSSLLQFAAVRVATGLAGAAVLAYFGLKGMMAGKASLEVRDLGGEGIGSLRHGFVITMTNPLTIIFWGSVFAGLAAGAGFGGPVGMYLFAAGCVASTILFLSVVARLGNALGGLLNNATGLLWLNRGVGLFLVGFAVKLVMDALSAGI